MFANPEDAKDVPGSKVGSDPEVERVRRAHLNDLENIPLFIAIAAVYMVAVQVNQSKLFCPSFTTIYVHSAFFIKDPYFWCHKVFLKVLTLSKSPLCNSVKKFVTPEIWTLS